MGYSGSRKFSWCLEKIVVRCAATKAETVFGCGDWLDHKESVRELVAARSADNPAQITLRQKMYR